MTAETATGQASATTGGSAGPGPTRETRQTSRLDGMVRSGIWLAVAIRCLGDRRLQANVITRVIRAYALAGMVKNNQVRPMRRAVAWYSMRGRVRGMKLRHHARRVVKPAER
jgi:hypothetical protein